MSGRQLSSEERRELTRLTKILVQKIVQVVVQSRLGEKALTKCKTPAQGTDWFNLGIEDMPEIQHEAKKGLGGHLPDLSRPLVVEILLRTPESDVLVLEIWTVKVLDAYDSSPARINPTIYNRMTVLLKSLICVTRITPAYKLSFRQGADSFVICYRVYLGEPNYDVLGDSRCQSKVGQVMTPLLTLHVGVVYRTQITLEPHGAHSSSSDPIMVKSDHFKPEAPSPKHCRRMLVERTQDSTEAAQTSDESQDAVRLFTASPFEPSSPRSRTSSVGSGREYILQQQAVDQHKMSVPFSSEHRQTPNPGDFVMPDIPFGSLLQSALPGENPDRRVIVVPGCQVIEEGSASVRSLERQGDPHEDRDKGMGTSDGSHKSSNSATLKDDSDFVMVELKTPFGGTGETGADLGAFYRECQNAPALRMFSDPPVEDMSDLAQQLSDFEANAEGYEDLVKSLHSDDTTSQE